MTNCSKRYVRPEIRPENLVTEAGVAFSGYNSEGLQDIIGDYVFDQSDSWKE